MRLSVTVKRVLGGVRGRHAGAVSRGLLLARHRLSSSSRCFDTILAPQARPVPLAADVDPSLEVRRQGAPAADSRERGLATLKEGARSASRARSAEGFLAEAVDQLGTTGRFRALLDPAPRGRSPATTPRPTGLPRGVPRCAIDGFEIGPEAGSCGTAAFSGETCISEDIEIDPRWEGFRELARDAGLRACLSVPLKLPDGAVLGTFATYCARAAAARARAGRDGRGARLDRRPRARQRPPQGRARGQLRGRGPRPDLGARRPRRLHRLALDRDLAPGARGLRAARPARARGRGDRQGRRPPRRRQARRADRDPQLEPTR